jgi:hypothetical protein
MKLLGIVIGILFISGCSTVATTGRHTSYYQEQNSPSSEISLFGENTGGLSEEAIQNILSYRLVLPSQNRVAILNLSQDNYWHYYSNDFIHLNESTVKGLIGKLKESSRVYDASFLPSLLIPEKKTLAHLRAAAARYQADILLTYRSNCQSFEKYKFINPDITRAYCTVEAIALDTRSGIIPFTAVSTNEFTAEKQQQDINFAETQKKAEMKAMGIGLSEVASKLRLFIESMPNL